MGDLAALPIDFPARLGFWLDGLFAAKFSCKSGFCLGKSSKFTRCPSKKDLKPRLLKVNLASGQPSSFWILTSAASSGSGEFKRAICV